MVQWLRGLFAGGRDRDPRRYQPIIDKVNALEATYQALNDEALRAKTLEFRRRLGVPVDQLGFVLHDTDGNVAPVDPSAGHETLDDILPEAFAAVREAARRALGMRHYDVQLMGGIALHRGQIAEMRTGEGKTLVASLPLYLNALTGRGCHLITPND